MNGSNQGNQKRKLMKPSTNQGNDTILLNQKSYSFLCHSTHENSASSKEDYNQRTNQNHIIVCVFFFNKTQDKFLEEPQKEFLQQSLDEIPGGMQKSLDEISGGTLEAHRGVIISRSSQMELLEESLQKVCGGILRWNSSRNRQTKKCISP